MNLDVVEWLEGASLEEIGHIDDAQGVSKVRLVGAEFQHGLLVAENGERRLGDFIPFGCELFKGCRQHLLTHAENVFLGGKAHFKVELIKLARRTIGPRILVTEAWGDLKILVKARDHQQQCIKFSFMFSESRAPSGEDADKIGVWISTKPISVIFCLKKLMTWDLNRILSFTFRFLRSR